MIITQHKHLCAALLTLGLFSAPLANAGSVTVDEAKFANALQVHLGSTTKQQNILAAKFILDLTMGGSKSNKPDRTHASWCAKIHKSYDAASNTFTAPNGKQYPCWSLFQ